MPIRNIWSLEPGECVTAEKIMEELKDCKVYFPLHDVGVDLLVTRGQKHVGVQVKESRYFTNLWRGTIGHSWHQVDRRRFLRDKSKVDFYIFLTYLPRYGEHRLSAFEYKFVVLPTEEISKRIEVKDPGKRGIYSFCFHFDGERVIDQREKVLKNEEQMDYSAYLDAWDLLKRALE